MTPILSFFAALIGALLGNYLWHRRKWQIKLNEEKESFELEVEGTPRKAVFIEDADQEELDEMAEPSFIQKLHKKIKRGDKK